MYDELGRGRNESGRLLIRIPTIFRLKRHGRSPYSAAGKAFALRAERSGEQQLVSDSRGGAAKILMHFHHLFIFQEWAAELRLA